MPRFSERPINQAFALILEFLYLHGYFRTAITHRLNPKQATREERRVLAPFRLISKDVEMMIGQYHQLRRTIRWLSAKICLGRISKVSYLPFPCQDCRRRTLVKTKCPTVSIRDLTGCEHVDWIENSTPCIEDGPVCIDSDGEPC